MPNLFKEGHAMKRDCDVCGGLGVIRLPVRGKLSTTPGDGSSPTSLPIREYSCPECGHIIPQDKIMICQVQDIISAEIKEPDYEDHCKKSMALKLGCFLLKNQMIKFQKEKIEPIHSWRQEESLRATLGVISPRIVATFEERVKQHQDAKANEVIARAIKSISNWDSHYGNPIITKENAIRFMFEALHEKDLI